MTQTSLHSERENEILRFLAGLAQGCCAGQTLLWSLRKLQQDLSTEPIANVASTLADDVEGGVTLSAAMAKHPDTFGPSVLTFVEAGEKTGVLDHALRLIVECGWRFPGRFLFPVEK